MSGTVYTLHPPINSPDVNKTKRTHFLLGSVLVILSAWFYHLSGLEAAVVTTVAVTVVIVVWWITDALPIPVTALVPIVMFPASGSSTTRGGVMHFCRNAGGGLSVFICG